MEDVGFVTVFLVFCFTWQEERYSSKHDVMWKKRGSIFFAVVRDSQAIDGHGDNVTGAGGEISRIGREAACPNCPSCISCGYQEEKNELQVLKGRDIWLIFTLSSLNHISYSVRR